MPKTTKANPQETSEESSDEILLTQLKAQNDYLTNLTQFKDPAYSSMVTWATAEKINSQLEVMNENLKKIGQVLVKMGEENEAE